MNRKKKENIFLWRFPFITKKKKKRQTNKRFFQKNKRLLYIDTFFYFFFGEERECAYFKLKYLLPYL